MRTIGPYTILEQLGSGGQGVVYLAEDTRLKRKVALKVIETVGQDMPADRLERFHREAEAASRLDHPNICAIHEAGEAGRAHYIAMRFVAGETLAEQIETARNAHDSGTDSTPSSRENIHAVLRRVEKVARALHVAHEQGLIHRDIKPGNIMLTADDEPVVLDFGLAREEFAGDEVSLTHSGDLIGTPAYMSPEQLMAKRIPLDRRTDVYSLGATLYECLTLRRPFEGMTRAELYQRIMTHEPSSATSLNRAIPVDLQVVLETALEKDRDRRYLTALDFAEDLRRVRQFEPIRAKPIGRLLRLRRWAQRHPAAAVGVLGLILALVVAFGFIVQLNRNLVHTRALALASAAAEVAENDPSLALLLAREAVRLEQTADTLSPLHEALAIHHGRAVLKHEDFVWGCYVSRDGNVMTVSADQTARLWKPDGTLRTTLPHPDAVRCGAFSPDGRTFATGCDDGVVRLWTIGGQPIAECRGHTKRISTVEFAPQGTPAVLSGSDDTVARLWDLDGRELAKFEHGARVTEARFSPDGQLVLTASSYEASQETVLGDFTVFLWHRSGERRARLRGHSDWVNSAAFSPDGVRIATASRDRTARLWDLDGEVLLTLPHPVGVWDVTFQPYEETTRILTAGEDGKVLSWDVEGRRRNTLHAHGSAVMSVAVSRSGDRILTASRDGTARLFDAQGNPLTTLIADSGLSAAGFTPDESAVYARSRTGGRIWDRQVATLPILRGHAGGVSSAVFSSDGSRILTASADATVRLWTSSGRPIRTFHGHTKWVNDAVFCPDDELVASASDDYTLRLWRVADGESIRVHRNRIDKAFHGTAISPTGDVVAGCSSSGETDLWAAQSGEHLGTLRAPGAGSGWFIGWSPNRPWLAIASNDPIARIWDVDSMQLIRELRHPARLFGVVFSPDGTQVATACADGAARIWDLEGGGVVVCSGHIGDVIRCEFSPDGSRLATASRDRTARIWDISGRELAVLRGHSGPVWDVSFSPDGRRLLTASFDMTVRTWVVDPAELLELATGRLARLGRDFTPQELARFGELLGR